MNLFGEVLVAYTIGWMVLKYIVSALVIGGGIPGAVQYPSSFRL